MTAQIAGAIDEILLPLGTAVIVEAAHQCMTTRGVKKAGVTMVTSRMLGAFRENGETRREFLSIIGNLTSGEISFFLKALQTGKAVDPDEITLLSFFSGTNTVLNV